MKKCIHCANIVDDTAVFCNMCGSSDLEPVADSDFLPKEQPKKKFNKKILVAIVVAIIAIGVLIPVALLIPNNTNYIVGEIENGVYTNKWANITFKENTVWKSVPKSEFPKDPEENFEYGFYSNRGTEIAGVCFEKVPKAITAQEYLEISKEKIDEEYKKVIELRTSFSGYKTKTIAGEEYHYFNITIYNRTGVAVGNQEVYARKKGSYIIAIIASSVHQNRIDDFINGIQPIK